MSSDEDGAQLMAAFQRKGSRKAAPPPEPSRIASPVEPAEPDQDVEATGRDAEELLIRAMVIFSAFNLVACRILPMVPWRWLGHWQQY